MPFNRMRGGIAYLSTTWAVGVFYARMDKPLSASPSARPAQWAKARKGLTPIPPPPPPPAPWTTTSFTFPSPTKEEMVGTELHLPKGRSIWWVRSTGRKMSLMKRLKVKAAAAKAKRDLRRQVDDALKNEMDFRRSERQRLEDLTD